MTQSDKQIKISIIVPTFNEAKIISRCLQRIVELNYAKDEYEIIVVNDGSTDNTKEIVENFAKRFHNIILLSKENGGKGSAVNYALMHTRGEYLAIIDSDTYPWPNYLEEISYGFTRNELVGAINVFHSAYNPTSLAQRMSNARLMAIRLGWFKQPPIGSGTAFRKHALISAGGFSENTISTTGVAVNRVRDIGYLVETSTTTGIEALEEQSFLAHLKQRLRWREHILTIGIKFTKKTLIDTFYTYGLSLLLFCSLLLSVILLIMSHFQSIYLLPIAIVFAIDIIRYSKGMIHLAYNNSRIIPYLFLVIIFDEFIRFALTPYLIYRIFKKRKAPIFSSCR